MNCKICNKDMYSMNIRAKVLHIRNAHNMDYLQYSIKYEDFKIPLCKVCGKNAKQINNISFRETCGKKSCISKICSKSHTKEMKQHLSKKRKEYLEKNKDKHNWSKYHNKEVKPEKKFREVLEKIENIQFYQYYIPNESSRYYELDFAIPKFKIAFEINGEQHYDRTGNLTNYYQSRHNYFVNLGWKVIEIHYSLCFNEDKIKEIISNTLSDNVVIVNEICNEVINYRNILLKKKQKNIYNKLYGKKIIKAQEEYNRFFLIMDIVSKHESLGLIGILSEKLNVSHTHVRRILDKYQLDIKLRKNPKKLMLFIYNKHMNNKIIVCSFIR